MTDGDRTTRNRQLLQQCHEPFRHQLAMAIATLEAQGFRPRIQCAWRSPEDELVAYASGHSHVKFGFHNCSTPNGGPDALAADVLDDDHPLAASRAYVLALARVARANGLDTGIDWGLPPNIKTALNAAVAGNQPWAGKVGWDDCHVEVTGVTIAQAMAGQRPAGDRTLAT